MIVLAVMLVATLIGCSNKDEEDAERISNIGEKVELLFNEDKTDLAENVDSKQFDEIEALLEAEEGNEFSEENTLRIESVISDLGAAVRMYEFRELMLSLVSEDGVVDGSAYLEVKEHVTEFENRELFYKRQLAKLEKIEDLYEQQLVQKEHEKKTKQAMSKLFNKDDKVKNDVTKEDYDKVVKLVKDIEDEDLKKSLEKDLEKVDDKLKAIAKAEKEAEEKRVAKAHQQSSNTSQSTQSNTQTASKGSSNKSTAGNNNQSKPKQQSKPKEQPKKEQPKKEKPKKEREIVRFPASKIGNSGKEFSTGEEAEAWANKVYQDPNSKWYEYGWRTAPIFYGYYDESGRVVPTKTTYTVIFF